MKYVCTKSGEYLVLDTQKGLVKSPLTSIYLSENETYNITKLSKPCCFNNETFDYELTITISDWECTFYYINEYTFNNCFKLPVITHYETKFFSDVNEMNEFLKTVPDSKLKDIKIQNKDYLVIYRVDGEV